MQPLFNDSYLNKRKTTLWTENKETICSSYKENIDRILTDINGRVSTNKNYIDNILTNTLDSEIVYNINVNDDDLELLEGNEVDLRVKLGTLFSVDQDRIVINIRNSDEDTN